MPFPLAILSLSVSLTWSAPWPGCPTQAEVEQAIHHDPSGGGSRTTRDDTIRAAATVEQTREGFRLRLDTTIDGVTTSHREIDAPTCAELADAVAVSISLAVESSTTEPPRAEPVRPPPPPPQPSFVRNVDVDIDDGRAPLSSTQHRRLAIGGAGMLSAGAFGSPAYGVGGGVAWIHDRVNRFGIDGAYFVPSQVDEANRTISGRFHLLTFGATACRDLFEDGGFVLSPCAGAEIGRAHARGVVGGNVNESTEESSLWLALRGGAALRYRITDTIAVRGDLGAIVPLIRDRFTIEGVGMVHRPAVVSFRGGLGAEILFF